MIDRSLRELVQEILRSEPSRSDLENLLIEHPHAVEEAGRLWADGFAASRVQPWVARLLVEHGAPLSIHAAAGFGFTDHIAGLLRSDPSLIQAKGGDGCTALHFARDLETTRVLVDAGSNIDARDDDHDSTPAQWLIGKAPEVVRLLLDFGARPDIFLATALGDQPLVSKLISANLGCVAHRIGRLPEFPPLGYRGRGGTILQWTLAFNSYPHQIALARYREDFFDLLYENSDLPTRLLVCCVLARRRDAEKIAGEHPEIVPGLPETDLELLPRYCWETNINYEAVRLMLDLGFPITQTERSHGYSPLHNAAWAGHAALVDLLLSRGHPVDLKDPTFNATPLGYAFHGCLVEKRHPEGDFVHVVESLLEAGSPWDRSIFPTGNAGIDAVLERFSAA
jgi:ankyrin repeat protein